MENKMAGTTAIQADDAAELSEKSIKAVADMTRQNMDMMLAVAQVATQSFQGVVADVADYSRKSVERTSVAARAMSSATSPTELVQMQAEFATSQFEAARAEISKYSDVMFRSARQNLASKWPEPEPETPPTGIRPKSGK